MAIGIVFILSLLVSSVSACSCSHHEPATPPETASCHGHSHEAESGHGCLKAHGSSKWLGNDGSSILPGDCDCLQPAPKAVTKSEAIKLESKVLKSSPLLPADPVFIITVDVVRPAFESLAALTDPHHNLTRGRAPPRL